MKVRSGTIFLKRRKEGRKESKKYKGRASEALSKTKSAPDDSTIYLNFSSKHALVTDLGLSMGYPCARDKIN